MTTPVDIVQRYTANNNLKKNILVNTYKNHYNEGEIKFCNLKRIGISLGDMCGIKGKILNLGLTYLKKDNGLTNPFDLCLCKFNSLIECLEDKFENFHDYKLEDLSWEASGRRYFEKERIINRYNISFNHESPYHKNLENGFLFEYENWKGGQFHFVDNNFKNMKERYENRINNFLKTIKEYEFITFFYGSFDDEWNLNDNQINRLSNALINLGCTKFEILNLERFI